MQDSFNSICIQNVSIHLFEIEILLKLCEKTFQLTREKLHLW